MMPGVSMKEVHEAILDAYTPQALEMSVAFLLNEKLDIITPPGDFAFRTFKLVQWADMNGRDVELVRAIGKDRPQKDKVQQVYKKYGMVVPVGVQVAGAPSAPSDAADPGLEKIVRPLMNLPDFGMWREAMTRVEGQVCRITLNGNAYGTGFLVGPDVVLTNYHVMKPVIDKNVPPGATELQFDFKLLKDGTSPYTPIRLAEDWLIDHSSYSTAEEQSKENPMPSVEELDYALIRIEDPIGKMPWAKSPSVEAPVRGWVYVPDTAPAFKTKMPVIIAQHPDGQPMKLAMDTEGIDKDRGLWLNAPGTRIRYATNTECGSSGSPCFDFDWRLIALHHLGDPKKNGTNLRRFGEYNQGVPIYLIRALLTRRNKVAALGGNEN